MEVLLRPQQAATLVHRILVLARDQGHADPRHCDHYWEWKQWPMDGRQWSYNGELGTYDLNQEQVLEHERRCALQQQQGYEDTGVVIERKLEGVLWGAKKFPKGRTVVRGKRTFPNAWFPVTVDSGDDDDDDDADDEDDSVGDFGCLPDLLVTASCISLRRLYDASITKEGTIKTGKPSEQYDQLFRALLYVTTNGKWHGFLAGSWSFFICSDSVFAAPGEQDTTDGVPCVCFGAMVVNAETGSRCGVVVDTIIPPRESIPESSYLADRLDERIAGFVIEESADDSCSITYVESAMNDLETLGGDQKDAFLVDRALMVNRFVASVASEEHRADLLQHVPTLRHGRPDASMGFPPLRSVELRMPVYRADPRFPLMKPNSMCLECGKVPQRIDPESSVECLLACSKCHVRLFCSKECLGNSWKSDIWPHKTECKCMNQQDLHEVGSSLRKSYQEAVACGQAVLPSEKKFQEIMARNGLDIDETAPPTVEELRSQRESKQKSARKFAKKKKKRGKKK